MTLTRKALLARTGAVVAAGAIAGCAGKSEPEPDAVDLRDWDDVRGLYPLRKGLRRRPAWPAACATARTRGRPSSACARPRCWPASRPTPTPYVRFGTGLFSAEADVDAALRAMRG